MPLAGPFFGNDPSVHRDSSADKDFVAFNPPARSLLTYLLTDIVQVWAQRRPGHARTFGTQRGLKPLPADGAHLKALEFRDSLPARLGMLLATCGPPAARFVYWSFWCGRPPAGHQAARRT